ncbi:Phosphatidylinositol 3,5-bisphosphate-binding protein [Exophiala xenobiotica]|uniref:Phosphatidylinositol 3,5-bisphosphate-binding protein n=1 Tax=Vermiconidia calcicola TaxID=1690605 RepID=A0AAV9QPC1_9PEZI|nr:Phosphatidylinositol 3,5-bisphosphate-binding protein [Exophiala xenobiotica]KAK5545847.1 Phosphatidylinositol 3,5-bisphosphate-binding protein [Vermiconidia calcicola]KAK5549893.1 Phosphatidylinositol 3,5-bisphosphate-binding protein [Chaetothyriales sp. CCFEE 6169]KAK5234613.1 Phosphatidylinositol 3,5-bisphosphate-binding protein [Exophiala xenobiotica]KAK5247383.1 Phosphatidylinositol 3,5-bisphosphate-binding protein [Exophiala xenobiotica]
MDTRPIIDDSSGPVALSASFNSDASCFAVGLDTGFCVFNSDPCELKASRDLNAGIGTAEMLGRYNYLALVGGGKNPRWPQTKVMIWDDAKQKVAITLEHKTAVLRVCLTKSWIAIAIQNSIHLYKFSSPPERTAIFETADNPLGLCCLGSRVVAFPGRSPGKVQLVELGSGNVSIIPAHTSALRAMDLSADGQLLATASEQGTLIRVYSTSNCTKIAELRRGVDPAYIFSIAISPNSSMLAVTSDKSTLHVFDLPQSSLSQPHGPRSPRRSQSPHVPGDEDVSTNQKWGFLSKIPLLPRVFSDIYSFASTHFEMGDENLGLNGSSLSYLPALGSLPHRPQKGILGWTDNATLICIGTGRDARWERFRVGERPGIADEGQRSVWRDGWRKYLGG